MLELLKLVISVTTVSEIASHLTWPDRP